MRLPYPPSSNRHWRSNRGVVHLSTEARQYKAAVAEQAADFGVEPLSGSVKVRIRVYRPRRARDLDNCIKVVLDALQGAFYLNDGQVAVIHAYRFDDKTDPRLEIEVEPLDEVTRPVFEIERAAKAAREGVGAR